MVKIGFVKNINKEEDLLLGRAAYCVPTKQGHGQTEVGMLRYGSRRIRKHLTMRMPKKMNNRITKTNVVFCSRDML